QIEQVLINLATNARDAMPNGGQLTIETSPVTIDLRQSRILGGLPPGEYVLLRVADTGKGMDAETRAHLFEPFFTTKPKGQGTGLGLSSVYGTIKQHRGAIRVWSEPDRGATFWLYLPALTDEIDTREAEAEAAPDERFTGSETILLVEDEAALRGMLREVLEKSGYRVLEAGDGSEALEICEQPAKVDLLLTDVVMPLLNGHQLARRLALRWPDLKVIYMSGHTDDVIAYHGVLDSGTVLMQKPFAPGALVAQVRAVLDAAAPQSRAAEGGA
ncbi:MAG: response regulator, partial [Acidobacteria bacterium]|nr:response regulator [Acidobacteriota bacterium]